MKKYLSAAGLILMSFQLNRTAVFDPYTQKIPGTPVAFDMAPIPGGSFLMGSNNPEFPDQKTANEVKNSPFLMGNK